MNSKTELQSARDARVVLDLSTGETKQRLAESTLSRRAILLFSAVGALAVANVYLAHPFLGSIAQSLNVEPGVVGTVTAASQFGYAVGLLFIVPLGDLVNRKVLILIQLLLFAAALAVAGSAPDWSVLLGTTTLVGLMAVIVQVVVAYVAALANPSQRGQAVGSVTSGVVIGILLARFVSGVVADRAGWRAFYASAGLMLVMVAVLYKFIPAVNLPRLKVSYCALLISILLLLKTGPVLRIRGVFALLIFAAFSVLWTSMVLSSSAAPLSLSHAQIGLFGLAGIAGAFASSSAGRWADQGLGQRATGYSLALLAVSWWPIAYAESSLLALIVGIVILFVVQAVHVTNQSLIFTARPDAQSRLVGAYMFFLLDRQCAGSRRRDSSLCALGGGTRSVYSALPSV